MVLSKSLFLPVTEGQNPKKMQLREVKKAEINFFLKKNFEWSIPKGSEEWKKDAFE